jgi:iron complex outermembrane recepter protein
MKTSNRDATRAAWKVLCVAAFAAGSTLTHAADSTDESRNRTLDELVITAQSINGPDQAPSQGSLVATEPQSVISSDFIQNNLSPTANYTDIIALSPSVWTVDPNGPGLMENAATSIRGFQDGQFNVTFDGIPWGDSNDFTHHSTSYFMAQDIGAVVVDRGPGNAATLGDATFGGTIAVQSDDPRMAQGASVNLSDGSFNTRLAGVRFDTGEIGEWGGTRAYADVKSFASDGYLSNASLERSNAFVKVLQPVGASTTVTFAANLNRLQQNPPIGETQAQINAYGPNYAYNADPTSQAYYGYNQDKINTDYEYLGVLSSFDGWTINNKLYTYAYYHTELAGEDPNGETPSGTFPAGDTPNGTYYGPNNVPGNVLTNNYRSVGDILRIAHDLGPGQLSAGGWYDHQTNFRRLIEVDFSDNQAYNPAILGNSGPPTELNSADRIQHNQLFTEQGYVQYIWHVISGLDLTAGDKYVSFERFINAPVNQSTLQPLLYDKTWTRDLPSADLHYKLSDNWSAYAQWAKGFLAPNLNVFYTTAPGRSTTLEPEGTTNMQAGTTWTGRELTLAADVYAINFSNEIQHYAQNGFTVFYNEGGTRYRGVEAEGTYVLGAGLSVYGNASWNSAHINADDTWVPDTPDRKADIGLFYKHGPLQGSLIDTYVGARYGDAEDAYRLGGYSVTSAALNYTFLQSLGVLKSAKVGFELQNLLNRTSIYFLNGYTGGGTPLWFTLPGRNVVFSLSASL